MFIIYIVDVTKPSSGPDTIVPPPFQPDYPPPPPNAIPCIPSPELATTPNSTPTNAATCTNSNNPTSTPIYYNQTVVLQCLASGVVSPVLIIRKVEQGTIIVGGGQSDTSKGVVPDHYCLPSEVCGDPVSQLHKIAFEVYEPSLSQGGLAYDNSPGSSGAFLSCMGEKVNTYRPVDVRQWNGTPSMMMAAVAAASGQSSMGPSPDRSASGSPLMSSKAVSPDPSSYFTHSSLMQSQASSPTAYTAPSSGQPSPAVDGAFDFSNLNGVDAGRVRRKRGSLSTGPAPVAAGKNPAQRGRKRNDSIGSLNSRSSSQLTMDSMAAAAAANSGALWSIDVGETAVWTIVGTDQVRYNFFVPPVVDGSSIASGHSSGGSRALVHIPSGSITPAPIVNKCTSSDGGSIVSLHGENFFKSDPPQVFFGADQSPLVEVRSSDLLICRAPMGSDGMRRPIVLVRSDGIVFPTPFLFP
jgi:hypothetical protein